MSKEERRLLIAIANSVANLLYQAGQYPQAQELWSLAASMETKIEFNPLAHEQTK